MTVAVLYLFRHGRTGLNASGRLRGHLDPPLDEVGRAEAAALAEVFRGVPIGSVVTSPLRRAVETAESLAAGLPVAVDDHLIDRDFGLWAGRGAEEVEREWESIAAAPGVEPVSELTARVVAALGAAADRAGTGPVAVVAHDAVNRAALAALVPALGPPDRVAQPTGCWNRLERTPAGWRAPVVGAVPGDGHRPSSTGRTTR